ncbi:MAG TPA: ABC transporter permease [Puia sp.]|nr:ABC transporter permease [Puia sp.]
MHKIHFKLAWRKIVQDKVFYITCVLGLTGAIAFCLSILFSIKYEFSFDRFHKNQGRLFRLEMTDFQNPDGNSSEAMAHSLFFPFIAGDEIKQSFPEVSAINRIEILQSPVFVKANQISFKESNTLFADAGLFSMFSFRIEKGDPLSALSAPNMVVLSHSVARKYFGSADPVGKVVEIKLDSLKPFIVSAVA